LPANCLIIDEDAAGDGGHRPAIGNEGAAFPGTTVGADPAIASYRLVVLEGAVADYKGSAGESIEEGASQRLTVPDVSGTATPFPSLCNIVTQRGMDYLSVGAKGIGDCATRGLTTIDIRIAIAAAGPVPGQSAVRDGQGRGKEFQNGAVFNGSARANPIRKDV